MEMNLVNSIKAYDAFYKSERAQAADKKSLDKKEKDTVVLSDTAKFYKTASAALSKTSDVREDKIGYFKSLIENGKYNISSDQLADKILKFV